MSALCLMVAAGLLGVRDEEHSSWGRLPGKGLTVGLAVLPAAVTLTLSWPQVSLLHRGTNWAAAQAQRCKPETTRSQAIIHKQIYTDKTKPSTSKTPVASFLLRHTWLYLHFLACTVNTRLLHVTHCTSCLLQTQPSALAPGLKNTAYVH